MIVLDEQLLGRGLEVDISTWYRGSVRFIQELRPETVVKDDAVPMLLRRQPQPTFVTINVRDFWRKVEADTRFCVVCLALSDSEVKEISPVLKQLLRNPNFKTKAKRMGHVIRCSNAAISYYTNKDRTIKTAT